MKMKRWKMEAKKIMGIDIETYSGTSLTDCGVYRYIEDPDFEILLIGYCVDGGDVQVIDCTTEKGKREAEELRTMLYDPDVVKTAWNANFERSCLRRYFGKYCPPEEWEDSMIRALYLGFPRSLEAVGSAIGLPEDEQKLREGKALVRYFCTPCKPKKANGMRTRNTRGTDPEKWELFITYNRQDVVTEQAIRKKLGYCKIPDAEHALWCLDQRINDRGVRLDLDMARAIVDSDTEYQADLLQRARELTGLSNPKSVSQLRAWLKGKGLEAESLDKAHVKEYLEACSDPEIREALELKQAMSKTSTRKYSKMLEMACKDNRARGCFQFYGASRSGRWAGKGLQLQNLPQNHLPDLDVVRQVAKDGDFESLGMMYGDIPDILSQLVRTAFIPSEGRTFVVSDFSSIEARVLAWLAGEDWVLKVFLDGGDIYCATASQMFGVPVVKHGVNGELRQKGKIATLACGYGGGVGALMAMGALKMGLTEEELPGILKQWRGSRPMTTRFWRELEDAAKRAIYTGRSQIMPLAHGKAKLQIDCKRADDDISFLSIKLPSGRRLFYIDPQVDTSGNILYKGQNQQTRKWEYLKSYGGKLTENVTQAIARDCLGIAMQRVTAAGYEIVMHVHDEMIADVPSEDAERALEVMNACMAEPISWAPGLPLKGDGYTTPYYRKD